MKVQNTQCGNCGAVFKPQRNWKDGKPSFCSHNCATVAQCSTAPKKD